MPTSAAINFPVKNSHCSHACLGDQNATLYKVNKTAAFKSFGVLTACRDLKNFLGINKYLMVQKKY